MFGWICGAKYFSVKVRVSSGKSQEVGGAERAGRAGRPSAIRNFKAGANAKHLQVALPEPKGKVSI